MVKTQMSVFDRYGGGGGGGGFYVGDYDYVASL